MEIWESVWRTLVNARYGFIAALIVVAFLSLIWTFVHVVEVDSVPRPSIIAEIKDSAVVAAACIGMWVGISGLSAWRRQLRGNIDTKAVVDVLGTSNEAKSRIEQMQLLCQLLFRYFDAIERGISYTEDEIVPCQGSYFLRSEKMKMALQDMIRSAVAADGILAGGYETMADRAFAVAMHASEWTGHSIDTLRTVIREKFPAYQMRPHKLEVEKLVREFGQAISEIENLMNFARRRISRI